MPQRRFEEGIRAAEAAVLLNPFDPVLAGTIIFIYAAAGNFEAAGRHYELNKHANSNHPLVHGAMGIAQERQGRLEDAIKLFDRACAVSDRAAFPLASLGHALAVSGDTVGAKGLLPELLNTCSKCIGMSILHAGLGDHEEAIRWLERGIDGRETHMITALFDPRLLPLQHHPAFRQLVDRMGLAHALTA